jgi:hypothetical protein
MTDFTILLDQGSIAILYAQTPAAKAWTDDHLPDDALTWGPNGTVIEHRYVDDIINGIVGDGLTCDGLTRSGKVHMSGAKEYIT